MFKVSFKTSKSTSINTFNGTLKQSLILFNRVSKQKPRIVAVSINNINIPPTAFLDSLIKLHRNEQRIIKGKIR